VCRLCLYFSVIFRGTRTDRARGPPLESPEPLRACRPLVGESRTARAERSPLLAREESFGREMAGYFGLISPTYENRKGSFTCRKSTTWKPQLYFPSEGRHAQHFLRPEKIRRLQPGLNPRSWGMWATCLHSVSSGYHAEFHEGYQKHTNSLNCRTSNLDNSGYHADFHEVHGTVGQRHGCGTACKLTQHGMAGEQHGHGTARELGLKVQEGYCERKETN
jgi:hypothetical protein